MPHAWKNAATTKSWLQHKSSLDFKELKNNNALAFSLIKRKKSVMENIFLCQLQHHKENKLYLFTFFCA
jgi:hypothetical protein